MTGSHPRALAAWPRLLVEGSGLVGGQARPGRAYRERAVDACERADYKRPALAAKLSPPLAFYDSSRTTMSGPYAGPQNENKHG
jgi:hypothetical protein